MANIRRVARKVEPTAAYYVEEQLWPVLIGLVLLGGFLIGVSLAYLPLSGAAWYRTAWPSILGIPLLIAAAIAALVYFDNRAFRRSLQLSLILCAILHVAMVVQMLQTHLSAAAFQKDKPQFSLAPPRPKKIVPEYHPTLLVPEEDRPRQDFEKPVEAESPLPTPKPEQIVRQPDEQEQSPAQPQPVPVPEQRPTAEPNVVNRNQSNEAAPRLSASTSRLSRQLQPSKSRTSEVVTPESAPHQPTASSDLSPTNSHLERQQVEPPQLTQRRAAPSEATATTEARVARRMAEAVPAPEKAIANDASRSVAKSVKKQSNPIAIAQSPPRSDKAIDNSVSPASTAVSRQKVSQSAANRPASADLATDSKAPTPVSSSRRVPMETAPSSTEPIPSPSTADQRTVASTPSTQTKVAVAAVLPTPNAPTADRAEPSRLAISRGESGTAGGRKSPNLNNALSGAESPALVTSSAARRAEATQRSPVGDALSPSAISRIAHSRASAEIPSASVKAEPLDEATAPGAARVAEVTASSGAGLTRADASARHDAVTGGKGLAEIDFGPTQIVAEAGVGRVAGGGQPAVNSQASMAAVSRRPLAAPASGPAAAAPDFPEARKSENVVAPAWNEVAPASFTTERLAPAERGNSTPGPVAKRVESAPGTSGLAALSRGPVRNANADRVEPVGQVGAPGGPASDGGPARAALAGPTLREMNVAEIPEVGPRSAVAQADVDHLPGAGPTAMARSGGEALTVDIQAAAGPGGLGTALAPEVGIHSRQGREDSVDVQLRSARFVRTNVGGLPAVSAAAVIPTDAYSSRAARFRGDERAGGSGSASPETEEAIERGLAFFARNQGSDGGWSLQGFPEGASLVSDTAATALALLAFQGAGYNHREFQYRDVVRSGIANLLKVQKEDGDLFVPLDDESNKSVWLYSHSLAAIAVCEAYGMTQDPALREPAQKAIEFILAGQQSERGGWRYAPGVGTDTSVTGWMMMALKSGELAGLDVPSESFHKISRWLDGAQHSRSEPHLYRYNPYAPDTPEQRHGRAASKTMTAVGLLMRLYTGWSRDNPNMVRGATYLAANPPGNGTTREPLRDTYYWYYATQVMAHVGGESWQAWMSRLHPLLVNSQIPQGPYGGSWDPKAPIADRWGPHAGRLYVTTMNLLSLEVQYRKLPLYQTP